MANTITNGTVVSFGNTPQAKDDTFAGLYEDSTNVVCLDVMGNDLAGNAKILWSLDNSADGSLRPTDLLTQDTARAEATSADYSANHAHIWITGDGKVGYDPSTWTGSFKAQLDALGPGQYLTDTFIYAIRMANGALSWATATVQIAGKNDAPIIDLDDNDSSTAAGKDYKTSFTENGGAVAVADLDLRITDVDNANLAKATVTLTNAQAGDTLAVVGSLPSGVTAAIDTSVSGVIKVTLTGSASLADYQAALKQITFSNSSENPDTTPRDVTLVVNDGLADSNTAHTTINVVAVNDAPVNTVPGAQSVDEDTSLAISGLGVSDVDVGSGKLEVGLSVAHGTLALGGSSGLTGDLDGSDGTLKFQGTQAQINAALATLSYQGVLDYNGGDMLKIETSDLGNTGTGGAKVDSDSIAITVNAVNDAAIISVVGAEDTKVMEGGGAGNGTLNDPSASGTLKVNDVDIGENKFKTPASLDGAYGTFTFDADSGEWSYTLDQGKADKLTDGEHATDTLTVTSFDGTASHDIKIDITGSNDNATISVVAPEDTAVIEAGGAGNGTPGDPDASGTLEAQDVDAGENKFKTPASLDGAYGTFTFDADSGEWTYTLDQGKADKLTDGEHATDTLTVTSFDGTASYKIKIDITGSNDNATISVSGAEDTAVVEDGGKANGTPGDPDASGTLEAQDVDAGENKFKAPASLDGAYGTFTFDPDSGEWTYALDQGKADKLTDGELASDSLTVTSDDGTASHEIKVNITGSNDDATIVVDGTQDTSVVEDGGTANGTPGDPDAAGTLKVNDVDASENKFRSPASLEGAYGTFTFDADSGEWTYTLDQGKADSLIQDEAATDTLTITSDDGTAAYDIIVDIFGSNDNATISVVGVPDATVVEAGGAANAAPGDPDASGKLQVNDVDAGENRFQTPASLGGAYGTFTFDPNSGAWTYALDQGKADSLTGGEPATDSLKVTSHDGTADYTITVDITGSNDNASIAPEGVQDTAVAEAGGIVNGSPGDPDASGTLKVSDVDAGENKFQTPASLDGKYGTFTLDVDSGAWTYTLDQGKADQLIGGQLATDSLKVTSYDGTADYTITVDITGSNDNASIAPDGVQDTAVAEAGGTANGAPGDPDASGTLKVSDVDAGENKFQSPGNLAGTYGTFTFDADNGAWTYTLDQSKADALEGGEPATDKLTITSYDGTATHDIKVDITGSNDAPVARDDSYVTDEDTALAANGGSNPAGLLTHLDGVETADDTDVDGDDLDIARVKVGATEITDGGAGDEDSTADGTITFKTVHGLVALNVETGAFTYASDTDYNGTDGFQYKATDGSLTSDWTNIDIKINAVNDKPAITSDGGGDEGSVSIQENTTLVTTVAASDPDGPNLKYSLDGGADASLFKIDETSGALAFESAPNFEALGDADADNVYDVVVKVSDGTLSDTQLLHVALEDVNEQPGAGTDFAVKAAENVTDTAVLADVDAADPDIGGGNDLANTFEDLSYSIVGGNGAGLFEIDSTTGQISLSPGKSLDYEAAQQFVLTVRATDGGALFDDVEVTVDVTDLNEQPTLAVDQTPVTFAENTASGTVLADVDGTDPDVGGGNDGTSNFEDLTYSIQSGNAAGLFSINTSTGEISLAAGKSLDFETMQQHVLTVRVTDGGGLFDEKTVTINVTDVAENIAPVAKTDLVYASNNTTAATISVASLLANDSDIDGKALTITGVGSISGGVTNVTLNPNGTISFNTNNLATGSFTYTLSDNAGGSTTSTVNVNIVDTNGKGSVDLTSSIYQAAYLDGGSNEDKLTGGAAPDLFLGGAADDTLIGGSGNDVIRGGGGNDTINGGAGVDLIDFSDASGGGISVILGAGGSGTADLSARGLDKDSYSNIEGVIGSAFNDTLTGNTGDNVIRGGAGSDTIDGAAGLDVIDFSDGTAGITFTVVQSASDTVVNLTAAGLGTETYRNIEGVTGTHFDDTLTGSNLKDLIQGGDGNDTINGNDGDDVITGGLGADTLASGNGNDTFVYRGLGEGEDTISDFNTNAPGSGGDKLDISAVLDLPGSIWAGTTLADAVTGGYVTFGDNGGHVQVNVDIDGTAGSGGASALAVLSTVTFTTAAAAQADLTDNIVLN
jgi:VCBS repeat-containing protein